MADDRQDPIKSKTNKAQIQFGLFLTPSDPLPYQLISAKTIPIPEI